MKIVFLSPVHPLLSSGKPLPRWQMQMSRIRALREMGQEVKVVKYTPDSWTKLGRNERVKLNIKVIREIRAINGVDLIIFSLGADVLLPITIRLIKFISGAKLIVMSGVSPITSGNPRERKMAKLFDLVLTNDDSHSRQWVELGVKRAVNLPLSAMDPKLHFPRKVSQRDIDVLFAGTYTPERRKFLKKIKNHLPKSVKTVFNEFIWEEEYAELMSRAKIVLNPLRGEMINGANLRMFEVPAFGALLLGNSGRKKWLEPGKEMVVYKDVEDAVSKIVYYLKNDKERKRIVINGINRVKKEHTFLKRTEKMLKLIKSSRGCGARLPRRFAPRNDELK